MLPAFALDKRGRARLLAAVWRPATRVFNSFSALAGLADEAGAVGADDFEHHHAEEAGDAGADDFEHNHAEEGEVAMEPVEDVGRASTGCCDAMYIISCVVMLVFVYLWVCAPSLSVGACGSQRRGPWGSYVICAAFSATWGYGRMSDCRWLGASRSR